MSKKILYRPDLHLDKHYETDGNPFSEFQINTLPFKETNKEKEDPLKEVAQSIVSLKTTITQLPEDVLPAIKNSLNLITFIFIQIDPDIIDDDKNDNDDEEEDDDIDIPTYPNIDLTEDPDLVITKPDKIDTSNEDDEYDFLVNDNVPVADINKVINDEIKLVDKYYSGSYLEITKDFINQLNQAINQYYIDMAQVIKNSDETTFDSFKTPYSYKTTDLKDKNLQHISDYIIKSQIVRNQKTRMYNKLFNKAEALNKIKACEGCKELYQRYLKEEKRSNNDFIDVMSNMTLEQSKLIYEKKLYENLYELYKYLNSSVIILEECLNLYTKEARAKLLLINEEGIKID